MNDDDNSKNNNKIRRWAALSGIGFEMGAIIFCCAWAGKKLDEHFATKKNWFTIGLVLFGVGASIYVLVKQLNYLNRKDNE